MKSSVINNSEKNRVVGSIIAPTRNEVALEASTIPRSPSKRIYSQTSFETVLLNDSQNKSSHISECKDRRLEINGLRRKNGPSFAIFCKFEKDFDSATRKI